jgi:hypothetical protein
MAVGNRVLAQDDEGGALPTLYAATQDLPGASYVGPSGMGELRGAPTLVGRSPEAGDVVAAGRLWTASGELTGVRLSVGVEELTGVRFSVGAVA